jgi:hypothetical protein
LCFVLTAYSFVLRGSLPGFGRGHGAGGLIGRVYRKIRASFPEVSPTAGVSSNAAHGYFLDAFFKNVSPISLIKRAVDPSAWCRVYCCGHCICTRTSTT